MTKNGVILLTIFVVDSVVQIRLPKISIFLSECLVHFKFFVMKDLKSVLMSTNIFLEKA